MSGNRSAKERRVIAIRALEGLTETFEVDPENIESLKPCELRQKMTQMGLDPDRPIPHLPARTGDISVDTRFCRGSDNVVFDTAVQPPCRDVESSTQMRLLVGRNADGTGCHVPIDELLGHPSILRQIRRICARFDFRSFSGTYDAEDLYQDALIKVWRCRNKLAVPGNILGEKDFARWLYVVVRNLYLNKIRKLKGKGDLRCDVSIEGIAMAMEGAGNESSLLNLFREFIEGWPESKQSTIRLWLEGYSYREIASKLGDRGVRCSHVTIGNWVAKVIIAFRRTVAGYDTEAARSRAVVLSLLRRHVNEE